MNDKFLAELARRLKREGIDTGPVEKERLPALLNGEEVMAVAPGGTIFLKPEIADDQQVVDTYDIVAGISAQVREYTEAMAVAPPLVAILPGGELLQAVAAVHRLNAEFSARNDLGRVRAVNLNKVHAGFHVVEIAIGSPPLLLLL